MGFGPVLNSLNFRLIHLQSFFGKDEAEVLNGVLSEMVALSQSQRLESIYASSEGTQTHTHTQSKVNKVLSFIAR